MLDASSWGRATSLSRERALWLAGCAASVLVVACSAHHLHGDGEAGGAGTSNSGGTASTGGSTVDIAVPGASAGADDGSLLTAGAAAVSTAGASSAAPLQGSAFFDLDCGKAGALPGGDACSTCQMTSCAAELTSALGRDWRTGTATGPCHSWFDCVQACTCNDQACYQDCVADLAESACQKPFIALSDCTTQACMAACQSSSSE